MDRAEAELAQLKLPHIPDDFALAVGQLVLAYADVVTVAEALSWLLLDDQDDDVGPLVTSGMPDKAKFDVMVALLAKRRSGGGDEEIARLRKRFQQAEETRNKYLHSHYLWTDTELAGPDRRVKMRVDKGQMRFSDESINLDEIREAAAACFKLRNDVLGLLKDEFPARFFPSA